MKHSVKNSPSGIYRDAGCPGNRWMCRDIPRTSNRYADEGTAAHALGELCQTYQVSPYDYLGQFIWVNGNGGTGIAKKVEDKSTDLEWFEVNDNMIEAVEVYLGYISDLKKDKVGAQFLIEQRLDLGWILPGVFGTADFLAIEPLGSLDVVDYKHGQGVAVDIRYPDGSLNWQLGTYALGAVGKGNPYGVETVHITVVQPRAIHKEGPVRTATVDVEELIYWGDNILRPVVEATWEPDAPLRAGEHCRFCPALDLCPETRRAALEAAQVAFDDNVLPVVGKEIVLPDARALNGEELDRILAFREVFTPWLKSLEDEGYRRLELRSADAPKTFKLVAGKLSNRKWEDPEKVQDALIGDLLPEDMYESSLLSPPKMEAALKRKAKMNPQEIAERVNPLLAPRTPGKPVMVPITDDRPALPASIDEIFD